MDGVHGVARSAAPVSGDWDAQGLERQRRAVWTEQLKQTEQAQQDRALPAQDVPSAPGQDQFVRGEKPLSVGTYRVAKDEEGNPKIVFDGPSRKTAEEKNSADPTRSPDEPEAPEKAEGDQKKSDTVTGSTDKVDAEIKRLKKRKEQMERQIEQSAQEPEKQEKLKRELERVEGELTMKDNDTYRRQHTEFTNG